MLLLYYKFAEIKRGKKMSPTSTSGMYRFRYPTGGEHISRLVETLG